MFLNIFRLLLLLRLLLELLHVHRLGLGGRCRALRSLLLLRSYQLRTSLLPLGLRPLGLLSVALGSLLSSSRGLVHEVLARLELLVDLRRLLRWWERRVLALRLPLRGLLLLGGLRRGGGLDLKVNVSALAKQMVLTLVTKCYTCELTLLGNTKYAQPLT